MNFKFLIMGMFLLSIIFGFKQAMAKDISVDLNNLNAQEKQVLTNVLKELNQKLPETFKAALPENIKFKIENLTKDNEIPKNICEGNNKFIYGEYHFKTNSLKINRAVFNELKKGREKSMALACQHQNAYDNSVATLIHEIAHAYDLNNNLVSISPEYLRRAGFKKGLFKIKNKNVNSIRSADPYEFKNASESFAVNFEYYVMDEEFYCRRPSLFDFYANQFKNDPYPNRRCSLNKKVMLSTNNGQFPIELDANRIYRVDYLQASKGSDISSGFGHSMFRLVLCAPDRLDPITGKKLAATAYGPKCLEDKLYHVVVSYRANVEDATLNYLKGMFGGYPSMLFILNFADVLDEYNKDELRDVVAYPLKLNEVEKQDLIKKIIEEHWNYRGAYKFVTNNCATESLDLLKGSLANQPLYQNVSITPNGLLEDLDRLQLLELKSSEVEVYKAKDSQLIESLKNTYGISGKNKNERKLLLKFIDESKAIERQKFYREFLQSNAEKILDHNQIYQFKKRLVKASSFSVLEQHILRSIGLKFKKKAADLYTTTKDQALKEKLEAIMGDLKAVVKETKYNSYGVPLEAEMTTLENVKDKILKVQSAMKEVDSLLRELMPAEYRELDLTAKNIAEMNKNSIEYRKNYRGNLEKYIDRVLNNMRSSDADLEIMLAVLKGDKQAIKDLREKLDAQLVSEQEITDVKLQKMISNLLDP